MDPIYVLKASGVVRYVGVTKELPERRLQRHFAEARSRKGRSHRLNWLRQAAENGEAITIEVLEWVLPMHRVERERYWIALFRDFGSRLINGTDGGDGTLGHRHSLETLQKMSAVQKGRTFSAEHRKKLGAAAKGRPFSDEHRVKISAAKSGKLFSAEHRSNMSAAKRGTKLSPKTRAKIGAARLGKKHSPEACAKMSASKLGKKQSLEHVANSVAARKRNKALREGPQ